MLGNLATTAAGVVAGSFLYQGIQNMMGHHNTGSGGDLATNSPRAASDANDAVADGDEVAQVLDDDSDNSVALDDGGFDSDIG
jgi:hypothetical protein